MRKLMLLMAMVAMVMVAAVPAFAQDATVEGDGDATGGDSSTTETQYQTQILDCDVVLGPITQYNDQTAAADNEATAEVANEFGVSIEIVQTCIAAGEDAAVNLATGEVVDAEAVSDEAAASDETEAAASDETEAAELPNTGGASLFTLGAGALLVGGGLLARRIFS